MERRKKRPDFERSGGVVKSKLPKYKRTSRGSSQVIAGVEN